MVSGVVAVVFGLPGVGPDVVAVLPAGTVLFMPGLVEVEAAGPVVAPVTPPTPDGLFN